VQSQGISTSFQLGDPPFNAPDLRCIESIISDFNFHGLVEEVHAPEGVWSGKWLAEIFYETRI